MIAGPRHTWAGEKAIVYLDDLVWYWRIIIISRDMQAAREHYKQMGATSAPQGIDPSRGF
jgi:hypothetical protein